MDIVIFKRTTFPKEKDVGDITHIKVGDTVVYKDSTKATAAGRVVKVNIKAGKLRVEVQKYKGYTLRPGRSLDFSEILEVRRPEVKDENSGTE